MPRTYKPSYIPPAADYVRAFLALGDRVTDRQLAILHEQYRAPARTASATTLGKAVGCHRIVVNGAYGRLGHRLADEIGFEPDKRKIGSHRWWSVLSKGHAYPRMFLWEMHEEVAEALEALAIVEHDVPIWPEEVDVRRALTEGSVRRITVNAYERSPAARQRCIAHYGTTCQVCGIDFGATYGSAVEGLIHVHHRIPIAEVGEAYEVNPEEDLIPVCPNCHAVLHQQNPPYTVEQVRAMLEQHRGNGSV